MDNNNDELAQLEELLCADLAEEAQTNVPHGSRLTETNIFEERPEKDGEKIAECIRLQNTKKESAIHGGETDSSDDEDRRNGMGGKYNDYGSQIKKILDNEEQEKCDRRVDFESRLRQTNIDIKAKRLMPPKKQEIQADIKQMLCAPQVKSKSPTDVYTDPVFGIRVVNPLISSSALLERMQGREAVSMMRVKRHVEHGELARDWVTAGALVRRSTCKKSQKGSQFIIWTLSDLKDDLKTVSLFLFRKAYNELWKTSIGTVVAVLNPNVLDKSEDRTDQACLSVDSPDRIMIIGQSKDFGICKSKKKNGEPCTAFVNTHQCEHCVYHVKQEYQKFSRRQELQSSTMGKGLVGLQNKVLGKNTLIYGGRAYSALPTAKNKKIVERDQHRLMSLTDYYKSESDTLMINKAPCGAGPLNRPGSTVNPSGLLKAKDLDRLDKLSQSSPPSKPTNGSAGYSPSLAEKIANSAKFGLAKPKIGLGLNGSGTIDLNISYGQKVSERAKMNAIRLIKESGGLEKANPHNLKGTDAGKKRILESLNESDSNGENDAKKTKVTKDKVPTPKTIKSERFKKILEATSAHQNLIEQHDDEEQERYFNKLEKKEAMEEKMLNTFKLACRAVRCTVCKYTSFSAAQRCKEERHPLKVFETFKRFFKCADCSNRTVTLELIPLHSCGNCKSSRWEKAAMLREKKSVSLAEGLSIRGEEESYIGGQVNSGKNINLLVPES